MMRFRFLVFYELSEIRKIFNVIHEKLEGSSNYIYLILQSDRKQTSQLRTV